MCQPGPGAAGVQVLRDSYFWAQQVKAAAVTNTARGITSKMLLLGTAADQVCNLSSELERTSTACQTGCLHNANSQFTWSSLEDAPALLTFQQTFWRGARASSDVATPPSPTFYSPTPRLRRCT
jgi:ER membrane protein complex subunit 1, C-terminal